MDADQRDKWFASYSDIEGSLEASVVLKEALPAAARAIVSIVRDVDASDRLRFDAAKYVIEKGLPEDAVGKGNPWDGLLDEIKDDVAAGEDEDALLYENDENEVGA